ncbi:MAG TPA: hypothetical protein VKT49_01295 [Bryobacteraceae bacterium]|nr:hypothetical protein [Bryobacteraceae bacterium]
MKRESTRGVSAIEFAFSLLVMTPLLLGTGVMGINMIRALQVVQLARDAGHMYARGIDFALPGNQTVLAALGSNVGLSTTAGSGNAVVMFSQLTYVDKNACAAVGAVDASGNPTAACTNYTQWVFAQRLVVGNTSVHPSNFGSPVTSGPNGVTIGTDGKISPSDQATKSGDVATFTGVNPYSVNNGVASGLPSGQVLYLAEAAANGFNMAPFVSNAVMYEFGFF